LLTALFLALNLSVIPEAKADFWVTTGSLTTARSLHTATLLPNGKVLVAGGGDSNSNPLSSAELYDPSSGTWTNTGSLTTARYLHTATLLPNGKVLVAGGGGGGNSAELYDPSSGTWTNTGSMTAERYTHTATLLPNGKVLVAGGYGSGAPSSAELYDPASGTWTNTGSLTAARDDGSSATLLPNGKVLVAEGLGLGGFLSSAELYDPTAGTWTATGSLTNARDQHTATLLPNGKVLVAGGFNSDNVLSSAELYDPTNGTWTVTGALNSVRYSHTATLLPNGKVLVAGGWDNGNVVALSIAELYDPASGTWTVTGPLNTGRVYHTGTLLPNGTVLVAGGVDTNYNALFSAELYWLGPTITSQPASQSVLPGTNVTFSVSATGSQPLSYQWRLNGANIPGATNSTYSITNVQPADGGSYDVLVANPDGAVASLIATLKVTVAALPFADNFAYRGSAYGLSGVGSGSNTNATRETGEPYHVGKFGNHSVWLQWQAPANGVATFNTRGSSFDTLLAVYTGTSLSNLTVVAANDDEGNGRFTSQVQFNAVANTNYIIAADGLGSANGDIVLSWNLVTNVPQIPMIVTQPADATVTNGGTTNFSVFATCNTNLTYQWYFNDSLAISGATNNSLTVSNAGPSQVGLYRVSVTSAAGPMVVSEEGSLEIGTLAGAHSFDKLEDLLWQLNQSGGGGFSYIKFMGLASSVSFPSVSAGIPGSQLIDTYGSTTSQGDPIITNIIGCASRWYLLTAATNGTMEIDTMGSSIATTLAVYNYYSSVFDVTTNTLASAGSNAPDGIHSQVRFSAGTGTNYVIEVDSASRVPGTNIYVNWGLGTPPNTVGPAQSFAIAAGTNLLFSAGESNNVTSPTYQWQCNGTNIAGATNATLSLTNIQFNQCGSYSVVVSNLVGVVTNVIALVSVGPPLKLDVSALPADVRICVCVTQAVVLQLSTNLTSWQPLYTNPTPLLPVNYLDTGSTNRDKGFYRLKPLP